VKPGKVWRERRASPCPRDELAGLETELLDSVPSEQMRSRLSVLHLGPLAARDALS
jgi:hypothetical protein